MREKRPYETREARNARKLQERLSGAKVVWCKVRCGFIVGIMSDSPASLFAEFEDYLR